MEDKAHNLPLYSCYKGDVSFYYKVGHFKMRVKKK